MPPKFAIALVALIALAAVEATAWWWMHPPIPPSDDPILTYRPQTPTQKTAPDTESNQEQRTKHQEQRTKHQKPSTKNSGDLSRRSLGEGGSHAKEEAAPISAFQHFSFSAFSVSSVSSLPEVYRRAEPVLRCSSGQVLHIALDDPDAATGAGLHVGWFEWDQTDPGSVLEAIIHIPDGCMGALGMKLVSHQPPITHRIGDQTLLFDHTIYRDPGTNRNPLLPDPPVHAFRAVWVAGIPAIDASQGIDGRSFRANMRGYRLNAALTRQRPTHARVIQAAVRGFHNPAEAWTAFEQTVLHHLTLEP